MHSCPREAYAAGSLFFALLGELLGASRCKFDLSGVFWFLHMSRVYGFPGNMDGLTKVNISGCVNLTDEAVSALCRNHGWGLESSISGWQHCLVATTSTSRYFLWLSGLCFRMPTRVCAWTHTTPGPVCPSAAKSAPCVSVPPRPSTEDEPGLRSIVEGGYISDKSLPALKKLGKSLGGLNLQHCNGISRRSVNRLVEQLWKCDILY
ncbi:hypothetical protein CRG98_003920 [Punica granatum]|uniref:Uncharacterized protein n=1 Tax=Punica granatum TaxID=22663 RepID=A0A2I0L4V5_PUNGR|nr:hypothetical protein CRG98_003920 [Punica granatum]